MTEYVYMNLHRLRDITQQVLAVKERVKSESHIIHVRIELLIK